MRHEANVTAFKKYLPFLKKRESPYIYNYLVYDIYLSIMLVYCSPKRGSPYIYNIYTGRLCLFTAAQSVRWRVIASIDCRLIG